MNIEKLVDKLRKQIMEKESVVVAFSGGVDSSVVTKLAYDALGEKALAVTVDSPLLPHGELVDAKKIAKKIGIKHVILKLNELKLQDFVKNPPNRCYICKKFRFKMIKKMAVEKGFKILMDGTNVDDTYEYRPGLLALKEENVYSPLLENGLGKNLTRKIAKYLKLPVYSKPSNTCLATRFPYGYRLSLEKLKRVDKAESYIKANLGLKIVRVRDHDNLARIEIGKEDYKTLLKNKKLLEKTVEKIKNLGFRFVTLDLEGYRSGSFDYNFTKN